MPEPMVTLVSFSDPFRAEAARARLEAAGIPVLLQGEESVNAFSGLGAGFTSIKLEVPQDEVERAHNILAAPQERSTEFTADQPEEEDPAPEPESAEGTAIRAWRAALFGMFTLPLLLHIYSFWLVLKAILNDETLSPVGTRHLYGALAIDGLVFLAVALFVIY
jgi:hypothetical protein